MIKHHLSTVKILSRRRLSYLPFEKSARYKVHCATVDTNWIMEDVYNITGYKRGKQHLGNSSKRKKNRTKAIKVQTRALPKQTNKGSNKQTTNRKTKKVNMIAK